MANNKILIYAISGLAILAAATLTTQLSFTSQNPAFDDCQVNQQGDITKCQVQNEEMIGFQAEFKPETSTYKLHISDVNINGESKHPATTYLYRQGFTSSTDSFEDIDWHQGDLKNSKAVINSLESASTCRISLDMGSSGSVDITSSEAESFNTNVDEAKWNNKDDDGDGRVDEGFQEYNDEPDEPSERSSRYIMTETVTLPSSEIQIDNNGLSCKVNLSEYMNEGMELSGSFVSWSGRGPAIADEVGVYGDAMVDFSLDSDGDSVMDAKDAFPSDASLSLDQDGDSVAFVNDACPAKSGSSTWGGCQNPVQLVVAYIMNLFGGLI